LSQQSAQSNECWCGSGEPYAACHLDRDKQKPPGLQDVIDARNKAFSQRVCLHPEAPTNCTKVIKAHTIQRGGNMSAIARDGKVYCLPADLISLRDNNGQLVPVLRGIAQVSVIDGFCGHHDAAFFSPIENQPFAWTKDQSFLLNYRALSRELYGKQSLAYAMAGIRQLDKGKSPFEQYMLQTMADQMAKGASLALRDLATIKGEHDTIFKTGDFADVRFYGVSLNSPPEVLCSAGLTPSHDFADRPLQKLSDHHAIMKFVFFNTLAIDGGGAAVFSCLPSADAVATQFIGSLDQISDAAIPDAIVRLAFNQSDNLAINPVWWDSLKEDERQKLLNRARQGADPVVPRMPLIDDGLRVARSGIVKKHHS
jgi:hypothetical protein